MERLKHRSREPETIEETLRDGEGWFPAPFSLVSYIYNNPEIILKFEIYKGRSKEKEKSN